MKPRQAKLVLRHVLAFAAKFREEVVDILARQFRGAQPTEVRDVLEQLTILERQLEVKQDPVRVHGVHRRLLRRILIEERRAAAEAIDEPLRRAMDRDVVRQLRQQLAPLEMLMESEWFLGTDALPLPRLTDYMSVRHAEEALANQLTLAPREFDEKFHVLEAPSLFHRDLKYYRRKCALRNAALAVAYCDIDDFKALNTRYTETRVDLDVLGPLMGAIEAHMFAHGHAYRFGGDEYVLLLPNATSEMAERFLIALQQRLARTSYRGVAERPTLSIGFAMIDRDTVFTDREILSAANRAKNFVKENRKGSVATFAGPLFRAADLRISHMPRQPDESLGPRSTDFPGAMPPVTSKPLASLAPQPDGPSRDLDEAAAADDAFAADARVAAPTARPTRPISADVAVAPRLNAVTVAPPPTAMSATASEGHGGVHTTRSAAVVQFTGDATMTDDEDGAPA